MKNIVIVLAIGFCCVAQGQITEQTKDSIDIQFEKLLETSNDFKNFKVVKETQINKLRKNTNDRFLRLNENISNLENSISTKEDKIAALENELVDVIANLEKVSAEKNSMNFLGIQTKKDIYNIVVWSIVGVLGFLFILMSMRFKNSNTTTKEAKKQLQATEEELEELRRKSIEKEQKLGRQLQDERNKLAKLKNDK